MLLEVRAIDGSVRSFELVDAETRSNEALLADWRAQVCDKIGLLPCEEPTAPRASLPSTALEDIFGGDVADNILLRLGSLSLARLGGASRLLWHRCGRNALWVVHHHSQFCRSGGAFGRNWNPFRGEISDLEARHAHVDQDPDFHGFLLRLVAAFRASSSSETIRGRGRPVVAPFVQELRQVYGWRQRERIKVRRRWQQVSPFIPPAAHLGDGLSDREIFKLEKELPGEDGCLLPVQLRELYILADGQHSSDVWTGVLNGHRFLPLHEIIQLWFQRSESIRVSGGTCHAWGGYGFGVDVQSCDICSDTATWTEGTHICRRFGVGVDGEAGKVRWTPEVAGTMHLSPLQPAVNRGWLVPLTSLSGSGDVGEWYGVTWPAGKVYKLSGLTQTHIGDVAMLLETLSR